MKNGQGLVVFISDVEIKAALKKRDLELNQIELSEVVCNVLVAARKSLDRELDALVIMQEIEQAEGWTEGIKAVIKLQDLRRGGI